MALISNSIEVFPTNVGKVDLAYYRVPKIPLYSIRIVFVDGVRVEVFNAGASQNFELPSKYEPELVNEIAEMIGVNIKEPVVQQYGSQEDVEA